MATQIVNITSQYISACTLYTLLSLAAFFLRIFDKFKHVERKNNVFDWKHCNVGLNTKLIETGRFVQ